MRIYTISLLFFMMIFPHCTQKSKHSINKSVLYSNALSQENFTPHISNQPTVTIWIHGTRAFFSKVICPDFFYTRRGLHNALSFEPRYHVREIAELLHKTSPELFSLENFYFYGWSGKLSFEARLHAAKKLYKLLYEVVQEYINNYGIKPKIRLITHSHGGNVALNLARFNTENFLEIDELILLACPVQDRTAYLIDHSMFKNVYSLYSRYDSFQVLDPQIIYYWLKKDFPEAPCTQAPSLFSQRVFPHTDKLWQIQLQLNSRGIMHIEFITNKFVELLPSILYEVRKWNKEWHQNDHLIVLKTKK